MANVIERAADTAPAKLAVVGSDGAAAEAAIDAGGSVIGTEAAEVIEPGSRVEVRSRFDDSWSPGFEVIERTGEGFRIRRLSDGAELPVVFASDEVRPERPRKRGMWWY